MSMPVLLTMLDAACTPPAAPDAELQSGDGAEQKEQQQKNCASYADSAAAGALSTKYDYAATNGDAAAVDASVKEAAAAACKSVQRHFIVRLDAELEANERVGLTGDSPALGEWRLERSVALNAAVAEASPSMQWSADVALEACRNISYRYFVYVADPLGRKHIRRWETQFQPRTLAACTTASCDAPAKVDRFGEPVGGGAPQVNRGWLTSETIVQLKFEREQIFQVHDIDKFDPENVLIKVVPLQADLATPLDAGDGLNVEVAKLKYGESQLHPQQAFGASYKRGEVVIFHVTVPQSQPAAAYSLVFHAPDHRPLGKAIVTSAALVGSEGVLELNVTEAEQYSRHVVARLFLPYVVVRPFAAAALDFRSTYAHYWPKSWPNLDVGHRGNGRSYLANPPAERENTLASFRSAHEHFADMIELDVHLTADGVPIIYHDFGVRTAPHGKSVTDAAQLEFVLVKDLSYEALKRLRVFAIIDGAPVEYPSHNAEARPEHRIFPTLVDVLRGLPQSLGIDVEIKWPQRRACGGVEAAQTIDKNDFVDRVLATIITHSCGRPLIFSSFDADICTMLRFKQNRFPVMFLTMGETKKWAPFADLRTRNFEQAINNAQAFELAGTAPHAEDFLGADGARMMQKARSLDQITLVWGDDCNSKERVKYFNEIGATATCYDRSDLYMPETKRRAFFDSPQLLAEFEGQCKA